MTTSNTYPNGNQRCPILEDGILRMVEQYRGFILPNVSRTRSYISAIFVYYATFFKVLEYISILNGPRLDENEVKTINEMWKKFCNGIVDAEKLVPYSDMLNTKKYRDRNVWSRTFIATWRRKIIPYEKQFNNLILKYTSSHILPFLSFLGKSDIKTRDTNENGSHIIGVFSEIRRWK